ncbi:hypothetical protein [Mucilaginibacter gilvus]|uniref:Redoxin domain-containing protein n=1 Tax=Mucilaginibacter gilvus TaxID=2305909 RepID=A0A444MSP6_9SPHI|nr:hypothetical protein [Mucilaginibacter gilvus]RWY55653.1 hypothetical protein EPL05_04570 [Mucilaginibacter gilvus]
MKYYIFYTILLATVLPGCQMHSDCGSKNSDIMGKYYHQSIQFPPKLIALNSGKKEGQSAPSEIKLKGNGFYVVHFFTADCDECINELNKIQRFIAKNHLPNTKYLFIASGPTQIYVLNAIKKINFKYDVYFEKEYYSFKNINHFTLSDRVFDTLLINSQSELLLAGALFDDDFTKGLYLETINCTN